MPVHGTPIRTIAHARTHICPVCMWVRQVLKLHSSQLAGSAGVATKAAEKCLTLHRLAVSVLPGDPEVLTLMGRVLFVAGKEVFVAERARAEREREGCVGGTGGGGSCITKDMHTGVPGQAR